MNKQKFYTQCGKCIQHVNTYFIKNVANPALHWKFRPDICNLVWSLALELLLRLAS